MRCGGPFGSGAAAERFDRMVAGLGGPRDFLDDFEAHLRRRAGDRRGDRRARGIRDGGRHARARHRGSRARRRAAARMARRSTMRSGSSSCSGWGRRSSPTRRWHGSTRRTRRALAARCGADPGGIRDRRGGAGHGAARHRADRLMPRAFLLVMDSVGCGGAPDAAAFGDEGANTLGHIVRACAAGRAEDGPRAGRCGCRTWRGWGSARAIRAASGHRPAGLRRDARGRLGGGDRGVARQGHAVGPLGARRRAGAVGLALFPAHRPGVPARGHRAAGRAGGAAGNRSATAIPRGCRCSHDFGRRAHRDRQADPLHLRRQRAADRRA